MGDGGAGVQPVRTALAKVGNILIVKKALISSNCGLFKIQSELPSSIQFISFEVEYKNAYLQGTTKAVQKSGVHTCAEISPSHFVCVIGIYSIRTKSINLGIQLQTTAAA